VSRWGTQSSGSELMAKIGKVAFWALRRGVSDPRSRCAILQETSGWSRRFVGTLVYPVPDPVGATLTVREREADPRVTPLGLAWRLVDDRHVEITRPTAPGLSRGVRGRHTGPVFFR
jgi:hypothetical protein